MQESSRSIEAGREAEAAQEARSAARKLESVARQIGALKAKELTDRLARQRDLALAIAKAERELGQALERQAESKQGATPDQQRSAEKQSELADEVAALADALKQLKLAAAEDEPELAMNIDRATTTNPPEEVEESMRTNSAAIGAGSGAGCPDRPWRGRAARRLGPRPGIGPPRRDSASARPPAGGRETGRRTSGTTPLD